MVDTTTDAVVSVNEKGQILFVNPATTNTFVYGSSELVGQGQADLAHINRVSTMRELTASLAHEIKQPISAAAESRWRFRCIVAPATNHIDLQGLPILQ